MSNRYPNRMSILSSVVMDSIESTFSQLGGDLILRSVVYVVWNKPVPNFCGLPTQHAPDHVSYVSTYVVLPLFAGSGIEVEEDRASHPCLGSQLPEEGDSAPSRRYRHVHSPADDDPIIRRSGVRAFVRRDPMHCRIEPLLPEQLVRSYD